MEPKGVGPATASAIVATWIPEGIFQSDELAMAVLGEKVKISYTMGFYKKFHLKAVKVLMRLAGTKVWDGRGLERVAWAMFNDPEEKGAGDVEGFAIVVVSSNPSSKKRSSQIRTS